jgi:hypothetical protein
MTKIFLTAHLNLPRGGIQLYQHFPQDFRASDTLELVKPIEVERVEADKLDDWREPILTLSKEAAQMLMDDLYLAGVRPSSRGDNDKATSAAMSEHLKDLRTLLFKKMGIEP